MGCKNWPSRLKIMCFISCLVLVLIIGLILGSILSFKYNKIAHKIDNIYFSEGTFFDESGNPMGKCIVEVKLESLDTGPGAITYYYDLNKSYIGYCDGNSIGCSSKGQPNHHICTTELLEKPCDSHYKDIIQYGVAAKKCVLNKE